MKIPRSQRTRVAKIIEQRVPETASQRKSFLNDALYNTPLRGVISLEGDQNEFAHRVVNEVANADPLPSGEHPFMLLLDTLYDHYANADTQNTIDNIRRKVRRGEGGGGTRIPYERAIAVIGLVIALLTFVFGDGIIDSFRDTPEATRSSSIETQAPINTRSSLNTSTSRPTSNGDIELTSFHQTAQANPAIADAATSRPTRTPIPPSATSRPTRTPVPPSSTPRPTQRPAIDTPTTIPPSNNTGDIAGSITNNADWSPQIESFNGVEMVQVPPGCFRMGGTDDNADANETPTSNLCIDDAFWIDRYEVTNDQFTRLSSRTTISQSSRTESDYPRNRITWFEANQYCADRGGRLPTEAEWEYAASGPDNAVYPWGNELVEENLVSIRNSGNSVNPVGSTGVSSWVGAYDMAGNVQEWTRTIYGIEVGFANLDFSDEGEILYDYPYVRGDGRNGALPQTGNAIPRMVLRGTSWSLPPVDGRTSARASAPASNSSDQWGLRCVRDAD